MSASTVAKAATNTAKAVSATNTVYLFRHIQTSQVLVSLKNSVEVTNLATRNCIPFLGTTGTKAGNGAMHRQERCATMERNFQDETSHGLFSKELAFSACTRDTEDPTDDINGTISLDILMEV